MKQPTNKLLFHLYGFLAILFWSTIEISSKLLGPGYSAFTITAWRFLIGGIVLLPFAWGRMRQQKHAIALHDFLQMALLGVLNVCVSMLLLQLSIHFGKASISAILVSSNPLFVSLFAWLLVREKLTLLQILGLAVALVGVLMLILGEGDYASRQFLNLPLSMLFGLGAALTFGLYTVLTKNTILKHGNLLTNSVAFLSGAGVLFSYNIFMRKELAFVPNSSVLWVFLYQGIVISGIAYLLFFEGVKQLGAHKTSMYFFLKPVIASLLAVFFLQERLSFLQDLSILVIISGLILSKITRRTA